MKDESWAAEFAGQVELACQDLVVGMALSDGGERLRASLRVASGQPEGGFGGAWRFFIHHSTFCIPWFGVAATRFRPSLMAKSLAGH